MAFLSACSSKPSEPTEAEARAALEQQIKDFSQGCIKLVEFHKTGESNFESLMIVNANAKIEFLDDCDWPIEPLMLATKAVPGTPSKMKKGEQRTVDLTLQFVKTDTGWKATQKNDAGSKATP